LGSSVGEEILEGSGREIADGDVVFNVSQSGI
jgi:hypothetical protein